MREGGRGRSVLSTKKCVLLDVYNGPGRRRAGARWSTKVCKRGGGGRRRGRAELLGRVMCPHAPNEAACQRPRTEAYGLSNRRHGINALDVLCVLHRRLFAKRRQSQIETETPQRQRECQWPPLSTSGCSVSQAIPGQFRRCDGRQSVAQLNLNLGRSLGRSSRLRKPLIKFAKITT